MKWLKCQGGKEMDKERLIKAQKINNKIDDVKIAIGKTEDIINNNKSIFVTNYACSVVIPPDSKNVIMVLLKSYYEEELHKLEQEFEEM